MKINKAFLAVGLVAFLVACGEDKESSMELSPTPPCQGIYTSAQYVADPSSIEGCDRRVSGDNYPLNLHELVVVQYDGDNVYAWMEFTSVGLTGLTPENYVLLTGTCNSDGSGFSVASDKLLLKEVSNCTAEGGNLCNAAVTIQMDVQIKENGTFVGFENDTVKIQGGDNYECSPTFQIDGIKY